MNAPQSDPQLQEAARAFQRQHGSGQGETIAGRLHQGLGALARSVFVRLHDDVHQAASTDSMLSRRVDPRRADRLKTEIELYCIAESAEAVAAGQYLPDAIDWYRDWLAQLLLADRAGSASVAERLRLYAGKSADIRRRTFASILERQFVEAMRAPLVVYRLLPPAVAIVTALGFEDRTTAEAARRQQLLTLPQLADCRDCQARLLPIGESCPQCGNPFWSVAWMTAE